MSLSADEVRLHRLPPGAKWFWREKSAVDSVDSSLFQTLSSDCSPNTRNRAFLVSWQKSGTEDPKKMAFGFFPTVHDYTKHMLYHRSEASNFGYEIVRSGQDVKAFADYDKLVKTREEAVAEEAKFAEWLKALKRRIFNWFKMDRPNFYVSECCRPSSKGGYKVSYHLTIANLVFHKNQMSDAKMKALFQGLTCSTSGEVLEVDNSVYSLDRKMRMPGHCKRQEPDYPLQMHWGLSSPEAVRESLLPPLITHIEEDDHSIVFAEGTALDEAASMLLSVAKRQGAVHEHTVHKRQKVFSEVMHPLAKQLQPLLQDLLRDRGDDHTRVVAFRGVNESGYLTFECSNHPTMGRPCLLDDTVTHRRNHARLFVSATAEDGSYAVEYTCMSASCPAKPRFAVIGFVCLPQAEAQASVEAEAEAQTLAACEAIQKACAREIMLTAAFALDSPEAREIMACYKAVDPIDASGVILEWSRRHPSFHRIMEDFQEEAFDLTTAANLSHADSLQRLYQIRRANPALTFLKSYALPSPEDDEQRKKVILLETTRAKEWTCFVRCMKQVLPSTDRDMVLAAVEDIYFVTKEDSLPIWDIVSEHNPSLKQHCFFSVFAHSLFTVSLPKILRCGVRCYAEVPDKLKLTLDDPEDTTLNLQLSTSSLVGQDKEVFIIPVGLSFGMDGAMHYAENDFARILVPNCNLKLRMDNDVIRTYEATSGAWLEISEPMAIGIVSEMLNDLLMPIIHLQSFREASLPAAADKQQQQKIFPSSVQVSTLKDKYANKETKSILHRLKPLITHEFKEVPYYLCFENGLVDLRTGEFLGPAPPELNIIHKVPQMYNPVPDYTDAVWDKVLHDFFPVDVYPDAAEIIHFLDVWWGYGITGKRTIEKALFLTGKPLALA